MPDNIVFTNPDTSWKFQMDDTNQNNNVCYTLENTLDKEGGSQPHHSILSTILDIHAFNRFKIDLIPESWSLESESERFQKL